MLTILSRPDQPIAEQKPRRGALMLDELRKIPLFADLSEEDMERLYEMAETVSIPAGRLLLREGDKGDSLFVVVTGELGSQASEQPGGPARVVQVWAILWRDGAARAGATRCLGAYIAREPSVGDQSSRLPDAALVQPFGALEDLAHRDIQVAQYRISFDPE